MNASPSATRRRTHRIALLASLGVALLLARCLLQKPPLLTGVPYSRAVYDRTGNLLRLTLADDESYRKFVPLEKISPSLIDATLLYEDRHFFHHPGINPFSLVKAAAQTYAFGGHRRGGSTITMQLARIAFHTNSRTPSGKLLQMVRALQLELYYSKREILEAYLNLAPYGANVCGAGAASLIYFGKEAKALTLPEAVALAVIPQNPTGRGPLTGVEPAALAEARKRLARNWIGAHPVPIRAMHETDAPLAVRSPAALPWLAPHATISALQQSNDSEVVTTLELRLQSLVERRVRDYLRRNQENGLTNAAVLLVDHRNMEILASVGSADFFDESISGQVDGVRAKRSPGSSLKPFIYALALDQGLIHPRSLLKDAPMRFGAYNPENFDNDFAGPLSATEALRRSRNVPAVHLEAQLAGDGLYGLLRRSGVRGLRDRAYYGLAIALGSAEVTVEELAQLYAALAEGGGYRPLRRFIKSPAGERTQLFSQEAAALTLEMLRDESPWESKGVETRSAIRPAWKTGTSIGFRDAWTAGVMGRYVLVVWVGHFDGHGDPALVGRKAAAPLFFELAEALRPQMEEQDSGPGPSPPLRVATVEVCAISGKVPTAACPHHVTTQIIPGVSPIDRCDVHRLVHVQRTTGRRACQPDPPRTYAKVFEFWPSDLAQLFARAGLARISPPAFEGNCDLEQVSIDLHLQPQILSPQKDLVYSQRLAAGEPEEIPLAAISDADVENLNWFIGAQHVGTVRRGETLYWRPSSGEHVVRVVDDHGLTDSSTIRVSWVE